MTKCWSYTKAREWHSPSLLPCTQQRKANTVQASVLPPPPFPPTTTRAGKGVANSAPLCWNYLPKLSSQAATRCSARGFCCPRGEIQGRICSTTFSPIEDLFYFYTCTCALTLLGSSLHLSTGFESLITSRTSSPNRSP